MTETNTQLSQHEDTQSPWPLEKLRADNEMSSLYDRCLAFSVLRITNGQAVAELPTLAQAQRVMAKREKICALLGVESFEIEVCRAVAPLTKILTTQTVPVQASLPLVPARSQLGDLELERSRRQTAPTPVLSPPFELVYRMTEKWAERISTTSGAPNLWIFGASGSGKTYLAKQLHSWVSPTKRLRHTNVSDFFQEWRHALNSGDTMPFKRKYRRETDLLILENLEDLQGKLRTQDELLIVVSSIQDRGGSVVVTSDRNPLLFRETILPALHGRLFSGMVSEMPAADLDFAAKLWKKLACESGVGSMITPAVEEGVLRSAPPSPRRMTSYFMNILSRASLVGELQPEHIRQLDSQHLPRTPLVTSPRLSPKEHIERVARLCGVSSSALLGTSKRSEIIVARRFVFLSLSRHLGLSNAFIANLLEKDPSTVSKAICKATTEIEKFGSIQRQWAWFCDQLGYPSVSLN